MLLWSLKIDVFCDKKGCDDLSFTSGTFVLWSIRSFQNTFIWWYVCLSNGVLMLLEFLDFIRFLIKFLTFLWVFCYHRFILCKTHSGLPEDFTAWLRQSILSKFQKYLWKFLDQSVLRDVFFLIEEKICWKYEKYWGSRLEVAC